MDKDRICIVGGAGQLGSALYEQYRREGTAVVYSLSRTPLDRQNHFSCDIEDSAHLASIIERIRPTIIINCAAFVNADGCEQDKPRAYRVNVLANRTLLHLAQMYHAKYVYISSYYVFDGSIVEYNEDAVPTPINYYGITKVLAESDTLRAPEALVIRQSKIFSLGYDDRNFLARLEKSLRSGIAFPTVDDQYNNPVHADIAASMIASLIQQGERGIYNVGGLDFVSNAELAHRFARHRGLPEHLIVATKTIVSPGIAPRPMKVHLLLDKIQRKNISVWSLDQMLQVLSSTSAH